MRKIRTLIAYDDKEIKNQIVKIMQEIENVEIIGTTENTEDTYNQIVKLKPEMVFEKYNFGTNENGLDIIKKSYNILKNETPIFNIIRR